jgi:hypothetical protein
MIVCVGEAVKYTMMSMLVIAPALIPYSIPKKVHPKNESAHGMRSIFDTFHSCSGSLQLNILSTDTMMIAPSEAFEMYLREGTG